MIGHNLSFDAKMLVANGVPVVDGNLVDTILMAGLVLRGVDERREGLRRPSLAVAVKEALGIDLPKTSQLSPWWRDHLTPEQIAYAALDAVFALKLEAVLSPQVAKLTDGPDGKALCDRLFEALGPVARMELAGVAVDREALAKQVAAWDQEAATLKEKIAKLDIANPSSARQVAAWLEDELITARRSQFNKLGIELAAHTQWLLVDQSKTYRQTHRRRPWRCFAGAILAA